jgi:hypothetical protein
MAGHVARGRHGSRRRVRRTPAAAYAAQGPRVWTSRRRARSGRPGSGRTAFGLGAAQLCNAGRWNGLVLGWCRPRRHTGPPSQARARGAAAAMMKHPRSGADMRARVLAAIVTVHCAPAEDESAPPPPAEECGPGHVTTATPTRASSGADCHAEVRRRVRQPDAAPRHRLPAAGVEGQPHAAGLVAHRGVVGADRQRLADGEAA